MQEITNSEANDLADEILLRNEFLGAREPGFFSRSVNWIVEQIGDALSWLIAQVLGGSGGGAGSVLAVVLLVVALVVLGAAIYRAIFGRKYSGDGEDEPPGARVVFDEVVDPDRLRAELARHRAAGDWRGAVISGFRLGVLSLIDQRIAGERPGATTGDFGRAVDAHRPDLSTPYRAAAAAFGRAFYSDREIVAEDVASVEALLGALEQVGSR